MMMSLRLLVLALAGVALLAGPDRLEAQSGAAADALRIEVLPGWRRADGVHVAGLRMRLRPGWKTYWRSAGSQGISPQMDWRGSRNLRSVTPAWPAPRVFGAPGALSIGYDQTFVLPLLVVPDRDGAVSLNGRLDLGVCADICVPVRYALRVALPAAGQVDPSIEAALTRRPTRLVAPARCRLSPIPDGLSLTGVVGVPPQGGAEAVVFEVPDPKVWVTDAAVRRDGPEITATAELLTADGRMFVDRGDVRITVIGERGAVEVSGCSG